MVSGSTSFHVPYGDYSPSHPESGLVSLLYQVPGVPTMSYMPAVERFHYGLGILDIRVDFTDDGFLTGWIRANDSNSNFEMISTGNIMKITDARSDQGMDEAGCGNDLSLCNGATGVIRRVATVPEPITPGLLGAGLLALLATRKKKPGKPRV